MAKEFDLVQREQIRRALLLYGKEHGVGVTILARRITAAHPRRIEVPIKSLQRFLGGDLGGKEAVISACQVFVGEIEDPFLALGRDIRRAYGIGGNNGDIAGRYFYRYAADIYDCDMHIMPAPGAVWLVKDREKQTLTTGQHQNSYIHYGVAVDTQAGMIVMLRRAVDGAVKYLTFVQADGRLTGQIFSPGVVHFFQAERIGE